MPVVFVAQNKRSLSAPVKNTLCVLRPSLGLQIGQIKWNLQTLGPKAETTDLESKT